jgi:hypothetical protein
MLQDSVSPHFSCCYHLSHSNGTVNTRVDFGWSLWFLHSPQKLLTKIAYFSICRHSLCCIHIVDGFGFNYQRSNYHHANIIGCRYSDGIRAGRPGSGSRKGKRYFYTPQCPYRLWGPPNFLSSGYSSVGKVTGAWSWSHFSLVPRSRMVSYSSTLLNVAMA